VFLKGEGLVYKASSENNEERASQKPFALEIVSKNRIKSFYNKKYELRKYERLMGSSRLEN